MENWLVPWPWALKTILLHYSWSPGKFYKLNFKFECSNAESNIYSIACFDTVFFEIPYINKLWICFDFHFCIFSCKRSIEKEYIYIIWKCFFFFMGGTEWRDYFNTGAWNHHCDVYIYIRPVVTTTYLLWCIYTSRGIQRVNQTVNKRLNGIPHKHAHGRVFRQSSIDVSSSCWS